MRFAFPLAAAAVAVVLLSGCVPEGADVVPPPATSADPVFASDEEALAAATEAYTAYLAMSDLIAQEGGKDPERIAPYVTEDSLEAHIGQFSQYVNRALHTAGYSKFDTATLQQFGETSPGVTEVAIYVCLDVSNVRVIDQSGVDVTPADRNNRLSLEVAFDHRRPSGELLMNRSETWPGSRNC